MFEPNGILVQGLLIASGFCGQLLVAKMDVRGFYCWLASNLLLIWIAVSMKNYGMVVLYVFYSVMCLYSIIEWGKRQPQHKPVEVQAEKLAA